MNDNAMIAQGSTDLANSLDAALVQFDQIAARFLATRKSEHARDVYRRALEVYRDLTAQMGTDPLKGDAIILYNATMQSQRRDKGGNLANDTIRVRLKAVQSLVVGVGIRFDTAKA